MRITDKINMDYKALIKNGPITIVALGDSVTHGALGVDEINYETVYWNLLRKKILNVRNYVPVNVINAGIGGINAKLSVQRVDSQVVAHNPDLVIVCFGLNDVNGPLEDFIVSLETIFEKCISCGADVIYMTPNMLNTYLAEGTQDIYIDYAKKTARFQNDGIMDLYIFEAVALAKKMGVTVCDCYSAWKELAKTHDTTQLLSNKINHPTAKMHELFANMLFDTIFTESSYADNSESDTMYKD